MILQPAYVLGAITLIWIGVLRLFRGRIVLFWLMALPGVILHELSHWMVAFVTLGRPGFPRFIPKKMGNVYALGRVPIHNPRWYNGGLIGLSPLLLIPLAYFIIRMGTPATITWLGLWRFLLAPWLAAECLLECLPSLPDLRLARLSIIPLAIIAAGLFLYYRDAIH